MKRGLTGSLVFLAVIGCQSVPLPREAIPPPLMVNGTAIVISDERWDWERVPVEGRITLYRLGRVSPNPWTQLAKETEAIVTEMSEKPQRVDVIVTSFRLVRKEQKPQQYSDPSDNVKIGNQTVSGLNSSQNRLAYEQLKTATQAGDHQAASAVGKGLMFQNGDPSISVGTPPALEEVEAPGTFADHPPGASCRVRATVRLTYADGREKFIDVKAIAAGQNSSGTEYYGEALDFAAKMAVQQYGIQLRQAVGIPLR